MSIDFNVFDLCRYINWGSNFFILQWSWDSRERRGEVDGYQGMLVLKKRDQGPIGDRTEELKLVISNRNEQKHEIYSPWYQEEKKRIPTRSTK